MGPSSGQPEVACQSQLGGMITSGGGIAYSYYNCDYVLLLSLFDTYYNNKLSIIIIAYIIITIIRLLDLLCRLPVAETGGGYLFQ